MRKRKAGILLVFCFMISMLNVSGMGADAAAKIRLNKTSVTMQTGEKVRLVLRNAPNNGTVTWSSSAKNRASVSKRGVVTAKKQGTATIRARLSYRSGGKNRTQRFNCKVTVRNEGSTSSTKSLVVYFSTPVAQRQGQTDGISSASRTTETRNYKGNTQYIAELISRETGAELFEIVPQEAYPGTYDAVVSWGEKEQEDNARPAIKNRIRNIEQYDTIYVGYPIWWSDMPQIMYTFFDTYDLSGKEILPFCTHAGSGLSGTVSRIRNLEPDAEVYKGLAIYRTNVTSSDQRVKTWIDAKEK